MQIYNVCLEWHNKLCESKQENRYSAAQIIKYAYRSYFMRYIICDYVYLQNKKRIMGIGAVEVP